jgi:hypothetical protein
MEFSCYYYSFQKRYYGKVYLGKFVAWLQLHINIRLLIR